MGAFDRTLITIKEIEHFVDSVFETGTCDEKRDIIYKIAMAERSIALCSDLPTLTHKDNRDFEYRDDESRKRLRKKILDELKSKKRPFDDEGIKLNAGGAKPRTDVRSEKRAFLIIGPPASGKSTISSALADHIGAYIIDPDYAKRKFPEYKYDIGAASLVHSEASALIYNYKQDALLTYCADKGYNIVVPKIGDTLDVVGLYRRLKKLDIQIT